MNPAQTIARPISNQSQTITTSGSSQQSAVLPSACSGVRLITTADCFVEFGQNPTAVVSATVGSTFLPAYTPEYFLAQAGDKIAVIQSTASGSLYITPMQ